VIASMPQSRSHISRALRARRGQ